MKAAFESRRIIGSRVTFAPMVAALGRLRSLPRSIRHSANLRKLSLELRVLALEGLKDGERDPTFEKVLIQHGSDRRVILEITRQILVHDAMSLERSPYVIRRLLDGGEDATKPFGDGPDFSKVPKNGTHSVRGETPALRIPSTASGA